MARFLLTVWPFSGHLHPNVALAHALRARGHEVAFYTGASAAPIVQGEGFRLFSFDNLDERFVLDMVSSRQGIRGKVRWPPSLQKKWREFLVGTIPAQVQDLEEVFRQWPPDLIVCDPLIWSPGAVLHERAGIPVSVFSYTMACFVPGRDSPLLGVSYPKPRGRLDRLRYDAAGLVMQAVAKGNIKHLNRVRASYDLPPLNETMPAYMSRFPLYMVTSVPSLDYNREDLPQSVRYVGACHWTKPSGAAPPAWLDELPEDRPIVYVSEGTLPGQEPAVLRAAAKGLADLAVTVVMTTGRGRKAEDLGLGRVAPNIRIEEWVPHDDLFPRVSAVVTTGGSGTVLGALSLGIPLVVVPMAWDQPENAWRVREAGAGLRIPLKKCDAGSLRHAVTQVLNEPSFRENARRVEGELARSGGPPYAAELLEDLVNRTTDPE